MAKTEHHPNGLIHYNPQRSHGGYTLFKAMNNKAFLIDMKGQFIHRRNSGIRGCSCNPVTYTHLVPAL